MGMITKMDDISSKMEQLHSIAQQAREQNGAAVQQDSTPSSHTTPLDEISNTTRFHIPLNDFGLFNHQPRPDCLGVPKCPANTAPMYPANAVYVAPTPSSSVVHVNGKCEQSWQAGRRLAASHKNQKDSTVMHRRDRWWVNRGGDAPMLTSIARFI